MKHVLSAGVALAILGWASVAQGSGLRFAHGNIDLSKTNQIATAKAYYDDGDDLILTLKGDALRLARSGLEARLFPVGDGPDTLSNGWGPYDVDCRVFVTVIIRPVRVSASGLVDLGRLRRLYFITASPDGSVSNGRWRLVLERSNTYPDPLLRLQEGVVNEYFKYSIYFEVKPIGRYNASDVEQRAAKSERDMSAIETRAAKIDPAVPCYDAVTELAQDGSLELARCATKTVKALRYQAGAIILEPTLQFDEAVDKYS